MATGAFYTYPNALLALGSGLINLVNDTLVCTLVTTDYVPTPNDTYWSEVSLHEASGLNYQHGGLPLVAQSWIVQNGLPTFSANSARWSNVSIAARYAFVVHRAGPFIASTDRLLGYVDLTGGGNAQSSYGRFEVDWSGQATTSSVAPLFSLTSM